MHFFAALVLAVAEPLSLQAGDEQVARLRVRNAELEARAAELARARAALLQFGAPTYAQHAGTTTWATGGPSSTTGQLMHRYQPHRVVTQFVAPYMGSTASGSGFESSGGPLHNVNHFSMPVGQQSQASNWVSTDTRPYSVKMGTAHHRTLTQGGEHRSTLVHPTSGYNGMPHPDPDPARFARSYDEMYARV